MSDLQHHDAARAIRATFLTDADRRAANAARYVGAELDDLADVSRTVRAWLFRGLMAFWLTLAAMLILPDVLAWAESREPVTIEVRK